MGASWNRPKDLFVSVGVGPDALEETGVGSSSLLFLSVVAASSFLLLSSGIVGPSGTVCLLDLYAPIARGRNWSDRYRCCGQFSIK